ncbi:hypothetical protein BDN70DRAFT_902008 [Pholiota conissans]|uniref:CxC2-like cysteine cluster KDZ transposase-associated domain-containing protein n=1 Tax=Pholiota conissans TaxID=109636 RepID=A0A9P5YKQ7_9AGAR|nr:hypothetical protein BDN70DRAFT_902008 [Pholiota conissans]
MTAFELSLSSATFDKFTVDKEQTHYAIDVAYRIFEHPPLVLGHNSNTSISLFVLALVSLHSTLRYTIRQFAMISPIRLCIRLPLPPALIYRFLTHPRAMRRRFEACKGRSYAGAIPRTRFSPRFLFHARVDVLLEPCLFALSRGVWLNMKPDSEKIVQTTLSPTCFDCALMGLLSLLVCSLSNRALVYKDRIPRLSRRIATIITHLKYSDSVDCGIIYAGLYDGWGKMCVYIPFQSLLILSFAPTAKPRVEFPTLLQHVKLSFVMPRPYKKAKITHTHDRISIQDDIEVVHSRSSRLTRNVAYEGARSPLKGRTTWTVGSTWAPEDDNDLALDESCDWFDKELNAGVFESGPSQAHEVPKKKYKQSGTATRPHVFWKAQHRAEYLDENIRWDGRGDFKQEECSDCQSRKRETIGSAEYRCLDCFLPDLSCKSCCRWTGTLFVKVSLKSLGLEIHLNHAGMRCPLPVPCHQNLKIIDTNGIHDACISYCGCHRAIPRHLQLLRRGLYPASQISTRICVTFSLLRLLHLLSLTSKASTYDLYRALERLTDNVGSLEHRSRYRPLLRVGLQWRHLKLLKRGGRGHDEAGISATKDGDLAIKCPSCPHPGINLPDGWEEAPEEQRFLYALVVCMDANFRLKNQLVSNYSADPGLGIGWAYMVVREPYEAYVLSKADEDAISTCVGFLALAHALTKFIRGLRYTGVGGAFCGRGEMILPNGVGNLQKGERYANMDYIFASAVQSAQVSSIIISYDIACQWFKHLHERINSLPAALHLDPKIKTRPLIPKFHEPAHEEKNHEQFSFNFATGVGKTDGEVPERVWAGHNGLGGSTKTQAPGSRHDVLDDHFGFWNWQKYCGMGATLMRRYKAAVIERNRQVEAHRGFTDSLPIPTVAAWEAMCAEWDADSFPKSTPNPFAVRGAYISQAAVREQLALEEKERAQNVPPLHATGPSVWLAMGLELEDTQRCIRMRAKLQGESATAHRTQTLAEQRKALSKNIRNWEPLRSIYIPGLLQYQNEMGLQTSIGNESEGGMKPEDVNLLLPSCLPFKNRNIRGQRQGTRSRALIDRVHQRALGAVEQYRAAREALLSISGPGSWEDIVQPLLNADVRSYVDPEGRKKDGPGRRGIWEDGHGPSNEEGVDAGVEDIGTFPEERSRRDGTGRTTQTLSWIWRVGAVKTGEDGEGDDDILRSEWARSRARVHRCKEEILLLLEEMRRVLEFLEWKARWWEARRTPRIGVNPELHDGLEAYALGQAADQRALSTTFQEIWKTPLQLVDEIGSSAKLGDSSDESDSDGDDDSDIEEEVDAVWKAGGTKGKSGGSSSTSSTGNVEILPVKEDRQQALPLQSYTSTRIYGAVLKMY